MNTYHKFAPNVYLAKCTEKHEKGEVIPVETKYGKENDSIVFNLIAEKNGFFYYSIVRADGFNVQEWAKRRAEKLHDSAINAAKKSNSYYEKSNQHREFLSLGEPIKVGHHSERRHRRIIEQSWDNMEKSVEASKKVDEYESRAAYWEHKANTINLSMPESMEYYEFKLEEAKAYHQELKDNPEKRSHSFSLTYAKKEVNELEKKVKISKQLWGDN